MACNVGYKVGDVKAFVLEFSKVSSRWKVTVSVQKLTHFAVLFLKPRCMHASSISTP